MSPNTARENLLCSAAIRELNLAIKSNFVIDFENPPEKVDRNNPAPEFLAYNDESDCLAIEHKQFDTFRDQTGISKRFWALVESPIKALLEPELAPGFYQIGLGDLYLEDDLRKVDISGIVAAVKARIERGLKSSNLSVPVPGSAHDIRLFFYNDGAKEAVVRCGVNAKQNIRESYPEIARNLLDRTKLKFDNFGTRGLLILDIVDIQLTNFWFAWEAVHDAACQIDWAPNHILCLDGGMGKFFRLEDRWISQYDGSLVKVPEGWKHRS